MQTILTLEYSCGLGTSPISTTTKLVSTLLCFYPNKIIGTENFWIFLKLRDKQLLKLSSNIELGRYTLNDIIARLPDKYVFQIYHLIGYHRTWFCGKKILRPVK